MKDIKCKILKTENELRDWNEFVARSKMCPILQSVEWGELKKISGWQPIRISILENDKIIAGISILKRKIPFIGKSIFYAPRGPIVDYHDEKIFSILIDRIREVAKKHNAIVLKIDPEVDEQDQKAKELLNKFQFIQLKKQIQPRATFFLDLTQDLDTILSNCKSKHRYNIRLALKKGVTVKEMTNEEGMNRFYDIYEETANRNNFMIHPREYYQRVLQILVPEKMVRIFVAFYNKKPIASVYIFCFGEKIWYMYGSSSNEYRNVMPNHAIHWEVIKWAKEVGFKIYDLWGIPVDPKPGHPLFGVYRFKQGFKGQKKIFIGMHDLIFKPFWYYLMNKGIKTYTNLRSLIRKGKISDSLEE